MNAYSTNPIKQSSKRLLWLVLAIILFMGAGYTWLDLLQPPEYITAILAFLPGIASLLALRIWQHSTGFSETYLKYRPLSLKGGLALLAATVLMLPILGPAPVSRAGRCSATAR
jgi:hypothetical protein